MELYMGYSQMNEKLKEYENDPLILTELEHSTSTVVAKFDNVSFNEKNLVNIYCIYPIVKIDSNYFHRRLAGYNADIKVKTTNRGRKKKIKPEKSRKCQGDGSCFNSCTQFTIEGKFKRPITDQKSKKDVVIKKTSYGVEVVKKGYKIKLFRNGKISIPGVLSEDMSDVLVPLRKLEEYLQDIFGRDDIVMKSSPYSVKKNYKFKLINRRFDIIKLHEFYNKWFDERINTSIEAIEEFILKPVFKYDEYHKKSYDLDALKNFLIKHPKHKKIYVLFDEVVELLNKYDIFSIHDKVMKYVHKLRKENLVFLNNDTITMLFKKMLYKPLFEINRLLSISDNNRICYHRYTPSTFQGFILKIRTPIVTNHDKKTTIKIFREGKVNIDGCNGTFEAAYIYRWFNRFISEKSDLVIMLNTNDESEDVSDSEFSVTEEN